MKYTCWGAAKQVTGSMHLLQMESGYSILIDCGIDYEDKSNKLINAVFPFNASEIDALILTHAHIDHSGNIPNLVRQGFKGEIFCTEPTAYLLDKLWADSVSIMNSESKRNKGRVKLYGYKDIKDAADKLLTLPFYEEFELSEDIRFTFYEAGHILGAASVLIEARENNKSKKIGFTGDLGNPGSKLIVDSVPMPNLDYLITETTYGNRLHRETRSSEEVLLEHVTKACIKNNGRLIIPAFSVGRTQAILFTLKKLFQSGEVPPVRVYADSPLALASTNIHNRFTDFLNTEAKSYAIEDRSLFDFKSLYLIEDEDDAEEMDYYQDACIIVSSAGMLEGGRIQQHISNHIQNPKATVLIAGFCAPGTLGEQLLSGVSMLRIKGKDKYVYASILQTDVFSAHPDAEGLKSYFSASNSAELKSIFFVHGEESSMTMLKDTLKPDLAKKVIIPDRGQEFTL
jgi:metallo-beta-lactamase family protein